MAISITTALPADYAEIHRMISDFANFQKTPEKVSITLKQMLEDKALIQALVVKDKETAVGFATYYFGYSSWSGKHLYLDDIYLEVEQRGKGIGDQIMDQLEEIARQHSCKSMRWLVSKWNKSAIEFYKKRGASVDDTECTCQLNL